MIFLFIKKNEFILFEQNIFYWFKNLHSFTWLSFFFLLSPFFLLFCTSIHLCPYSSSHLSIHPFAHPYLSIRIIQSTHPYLSIHNIHPTHPPTPAEPVCPPRGGGGGDARGACARPRHHHTRLRVRGGHRRRRGLEGVHGHSNRCALTGREHSDRRRELVIIVLFSFFSLIITTIHTHKHTINHSFMHASTTTPSRLPDGAEGGPPRPPPAGDDRGGCCGLPVLGARAAAPVQAVRHDGKAAHQRRRGVADPPQHHLLVQGQRPLHGHHGERRGRERSTRVLPQRRGREDERPPLLRGLGVDQRLRHPANGLPLWHGEGGGAGAGTESHLPRNTPRRVLGWHHQRCGTRRMDEARKRWGDREVREGGKRAKTNEKRNFKFYIFVWLFLFDTHKQAYALIRTHTYTHKIIVIKVRVTVLVLTIAVGWCSIYWLCCVCSPPPVYHITASGWERVSSEDQTDLHYQRYKGTERTYTIQDDLTVKAEWGHTHGVDDVGEDRTERTDLKRKHG